jgi:hypothetical protein
VEPAVGERRPAGDSTVGLDGDPRVARQICRPPVAGELLDGVLRLAVVAAVGLGHQVEDGRQVVEDRWTQNEPSDNQRRLGHRGSSTVEKGQIRARRASAVASGSYHRSAADVDAGAPVARP